MFNSSENLAKLLWFNFSKAKTIFNSSEILAKSAKSQMFNFKDFDSTIAKCREIVCTQKCNENCVEWMGIEWDVAMEISKTLPELRVNNRRYLSWNRFHSPSGSWGVENRPWQTTRPNHTDRARIHWIQSLKKYHRTTACLCCWEVLSRAMTQIHRAIRCNRVHLSLVLSFRFRFAWWCRATVGPGS